MFVLGSIKLYTGREPLFLAGEIQSMRRKVRIQRLVDTSAVYIPAPSCLAAFRLVGAIAHYVGGEYCEWSRIHDCQGHRITITTVYHPP